MIKENDLTVLWSFELPQVRNVSYSAAGQYLCCHSWKAEDIDGEYLANYALFKLDLAGNEIDRYEPFDPLLFSYTLCPDGGLVVVQGKRPPEGDDLLKRRETNQLVRLNADWKKVWEWQAPVDLQKPMYTTAGSTYVIGGTRLDEEKNLYALNDSGNLRWELDISGDAWNMGSALAEAADGSIYVASDNNRLIKISVGGELLWIVDDWQGDSAENMRSKFNQGNVMVTADGTIVTTLSNSWVHAVHPDGTPRWSYQTTHGFRYSLASDADGNVFIGDHGGWLHALEPDGTLLWKQEIGTTCPVIAVSNTDDQLYCTDFEVLQVRSKRQGR